MSGLFRRKRVGGTDAPTGAAVVLPAGTDLDQLVGAPPATRRRARLRRRVRHLRGVREVLLRDLGGMVFEVHRAGVGESATVGDKLERLSGVDAELRELEAQLDDHRGMVVREPGIGGSCPSCGELFGSEARFCWACGTPVAPGAERPAEAIRPALAATAALPPPPTAPPVDLPPPPS